jgi:CubicO group peptidase (beta-lactamase class C family)
VIPSATVTKMLLARTYLIIVTASVSCFAQPSAPALAADRLARIDRVLQQYIDQDQVAGAVALVLRDGKPVYDKAFGWADKEAGRKMTTSTLFRIASQTKAITSTAVMALIEEGKIGINEPVGNFIPTFKRTTVAVNDGGTTRTVPAKRPINIAQLLTHTAGISYGREPYVANSYEAKGLGPAAGNGWYTADKDEPICRTMERLGTLPFVAQPGDSYVYGYNTDILGCVVEKASNMPLDQFIQQRITGPLGMKDTRFFVPASDRGRLAAVYASGSDGKIVRAPEGSKGQGHYVDGPRKSFAGGAGLTSSARDYARFLEMIRNGGTLDGVRILGPRATALMTTNPLDNGSRLWIWFSNGGPLRSKWHGQCRFLRLGRRVRDYVPGGPRRSPCGCADDSVNAEFHRHPF